MVGYDCCKKSTLRQTGQDFNSGSEFLVKRTVSSIQTSESIVEGV